MSKLAKTARARAEHYLAIMVNNPVIVVEMEKTAKVLDRKARDPSTPKSKAANAAMRATALFLLIAEVMERVEAKRRSEVERN